ncbi:hypothetical protein BJ508DRAFT_332236 [Ascobolus immersus RN42]|uniref:Uncharacterized protein n=1 Tax=Ascobolus immersus RN42 TaxID=1160509 RepID=A0A3N4HTF2_ASCIM|nr:hypothetical protein BJ508DRAFT_332236 [Ascobolus immersus RN42]
MGRTPSKQPTWPKLGSGSKARPRTAGLHLASQTSIKGIDYTNASDEAKMVQAKAANSTGEPLSGSEQSGSEEPAATHSSSSEETDDSSTPSTNSTETSSDEESSESEWEELPKPTKPIKEPLTKRRLYKYLRRTLRDEVPQGGVKKLKTDLALESVPNVRWACKGYTWPKHHRLCLKPFDELTPPELNELALALNGGATWVEIKRDGSSAVETQKSDADEESSYATKKKRATQAAVKKLLHSHVVKIIPDISEDDMTLSSTRSAKKGYVWICKPGYNLPQLNAKSKRGEVMVKGLYQINTTERQEIEDALKNGKLRAELYRDGEHVEAKIADKQTMRTNILNAIKEELSSKFDIPKETLDSLKVEDIQFTFKFLYSQKIFRWQHKGYVIPQIDPERTTKPLRNKVFSELNKAELEKMLLAIKQGTLQPVALDGSRDSEKEKVGADDQINNDSIPGVKELSSNEEGLDSSMADDSTIDVSESAQDVLGLDEGVEIVRVSGTSFVTKFVFDDGMGLKPFTLSGTRLEPHGNKFQFTFFDAAGTGKTRNTYIAMEKNA